MAIGATWATGSSVHTNLSTGSSGVTNSSRTYSNSAFIRELWSDEIVAAYKTNLVLGNLVVTMNHQGKKGDTVHVPRPTRAAASEKTHETQVTLIAANESQTAYNIDQHWEYSRLIEDVVSVQADDSLRRFYTDDAGYALAKNSDSKLHAEGAKFGGGDPTKADRDVEGSSYSKAVVGTPSAGSLVAWASGGAGNASVLTEEGVRLIIQNLDDSDVPSRERYLVIPPVEKKTLLGIPRFTEQAFVGEVGNGNSIRTGRVGDVFGVEIFVSTNCENVAAGDASTDQLAALMFQKEALLYIEQIAPRTQTQYKQEYLADLFTADTLFGTGVLRPEGGVGIIVPE